MFDSTFRPIEVEVRGEWRRLHNRELYDLYLPPNVMMNKSTRNTRAEYRHIWGESKYVYTVLVGNTSRDYLVELGVNGTTSLT